MGATDSTIHLRIKRCGAEDIAAAGAFYDAVIAHMDRHHANAPKWNYKEYPSEGSVRAHTAVGTQYVCLLDGAVCGAFVLDSEPGGAYGKGAWTVSLDTGEYMVIHALAVGPAYAGKGIGTQAVRFCIEYARNHGYRAIRLDVVPSNLPALRLYRRLGFSDAGTVDLERGLPEIPEFTLMEYNFPPAPFPVDSNAAEKDMTAFAGT